MRFNVKFFPVTSPLTAAELAAGDDYVSGNKHVESAEIENDGDQEAFAAALNIAAPQKNLRVLGNVEEVFALHDRERATMWLAEYADIDAGESDDDEVMYEAVVERI